MAAAFCSESPLVVAVSIGGFEEVGELSCVESFSSFREDGGEVDGAVVRGVVRREFLVEGVEPVFFPEGGPFSA